MQTSSMETWCAHIASLVPSDLTAIPNPDTPCGRCHRLPNPYPIWRCLYCKVVFCGLRVGSHMYEHHKESNHSLAISCSKKDPVVFCYFCKINAKAHQVIQQLQAFSKDKSSSSKLEKLDAMMVEVSNLISEPFPSFDFHQPEAKSSVGQDEYALAKEGLQKIFDRGLEALADDQVQKEFLTYTAMLLSVDSCPSQLKSNLSSFTENLPEETSTFVQAKQKLKVVSDLSASVTHKKFMLRQQSSKYTETKKKSIASEEKIANLKARIQKLEASLATEKRNKAKIDEVLNSIETQVITARDGLVSDLAQVSAMEGTTQAANLVAQQQSAWNSLRTTFTKFA
ncbi:uncharacterized protein LOC133739005 isoform X1 [Rosa rugosa]|uniref:uncharacterized protein LOC133739005 isoform X1 n=1 Tax=Rosa rugosa TaxID=74645 RepID=UPI002B400E7B|nr:uncharacterized protein LOC133739005 isoform X1 [Rosa rugosa]